jgi:CheY-like chemotaxis protein
MTKEFPFVLLADDDPDDRDFFCAGMKRLFPRVEVLSFEDGDELLEFMNNSSLRLLPCCILLDYKMPRLSGPEVLQATGMGTPFDHVPKIVWSTSQRQIDIDECLRLGATRFAVKPESGAQLDNLIKSLARYLLTSQNNVISDQ